MQRVEPSCGRASADEAVGDDGPRYGLGAHAGLALCTLAVYLVGNDAVPLFDRDETRYAQAVVQMLDRGDWIVPYYLTYDISGDPDRPDPRFHKPPFVYWTQALACLALGRHEFALRLPNALFGVAAVMLTVWLGRILFGPPAGFWAGVVLASAPLMIAAAKLCLCDSPLTMFTVGATALFAHQVRYGPRPALAAAFWATLGAGVLTKGPAILLFVVPAVVGVLVAGGAATRRRAADALAVAPPGPGTGVMRALLHAATGPLIAAAVVAAWLVPVQLRTDGEFLRVALGTHVLSRALESMEGHTGPPGFYLLVVTVAFFPWSFLLAGPVVRAVRATWAGSTAPAPEHDGADAPAGAAPGLASPARWAFPLLSAWLLVPWLLLEIHATKLPHYLLPTIPAAALLLGRSLSHTGRTAAATDDAPPPGRAALWSVAGVFIAFAAAVILLTVAVDREWDLPGLLYGDSTSRSAAAFRDAWNLLRPSDPHGVYWRVFIIAAFVGLAGVAAAAVFRGPARRPFAARTAPALLPAGTMVVLYTAVFAQLPALHLSRRLAEHIRREYGRIEVIAAGFDVDGTAAGFAEPGLVYYLGGGVRIARDPLELDRLLARPGRRVLVLEAHHWRHLAKSRSDLGEPQAVLEGLNYTKGRVARPAVGVVGSEAVGRP